MPNTTSPPTSPATHPDDVDLLLDAGPGPLTDPDLLDINELQDEMRCRREVDQAREARGEHPLTAEEREQVAAALRADHLGPEDQALAEIAHERYPAVWREAVAQAREPVPACFVAVIPPGRSRALIRPPTCSARHRRAPRARPVRVRGSRRTTAARAGPDDPDGESEPPGLRLGRHPFDPVGGAR